MKNVTQKMIARVLGSMALVCLVVSAAGVAGAAAEPIKTIGQAAIYGSDVANARDKAVDDALRKAVEQAVGTLVSSETVTENFQLISDKIISQAKGYIQKYTIVAEGRQGGIYQVTIEAFVAKGELSGDLDGILQILKSKNMPRVLLMVSEQNIGGASSVWWGDKGSSVDLGVVENTFVDAWSPKGIRFVDRQSVMGTLRTTGALSGSEATNALAKEFGSKTGAEIVIIGKAIASDSGAILNTKMHSIQGTMSVRALQVDTGEIIATETINQTTGHINPVTGGANVFKMASRAVAANLLKKILLKWGSEVSGPALVKLTVSNIKKSKFIRQVAEVLRNQVRGVSTVRQRFFRNKKAELEVELKGSAQDLAEELEDKVFSAFEVEITEITANTVSAKLILKK